MIASWMLYSTLVAACAACIAVVADTMLRVSRRPTRWLWAATFAAGVVVPALAAIRPRAVSAVMPAGDGLLPETVGAQVAPVSTMSVDAWLGVAWIGAGVLVALVLVVGLAQLSRARRRAARGTLAGREVALTDDLGPGALPFGEPKILVPRWASSLPADAARLLVLHEEEHVRAGDARLLFGAALVLAAMPWNAVLWWSLRRLRTAIELDCDARVLRGESSVGPYAELLLQVAGRGRGAPALLALTDSTSQLKTRIDAMTVARVLTPFRRATLGVLAVGAFVAGCEARRPDPVAPVTDYVLTEGRATAIAGNPQLAESVKVRLAGSMKSLDSSTRGTDPKKPVLLVHDAKGKVVFAGRMDSSKVLDAIPSADVATIDVVKRGDLLPEEMRGGLVSVYLKPEATWKSPTVRDTSLHYKSPKEPAASPAVEAASEASDPIRVTLEDASGSVIYEGAWTTKSADGVGPYRFSPQEISRIEVNKSGGSKRITIRLKEGAQVGRR